MNTIKEFFVKYLFKEQTKLLCCTQNNSKPCDVKLDNDNLIISSNINDYKSKVVEDENKEKKNKINDKKGNKKMLFKRSTTFIS